MFFQIPDFTEKTTIENNEEGGGEKYCQGIEEEPVASRHCWAIELITIEGNARSGWKFSSVIKSIHTWRIKAKVKAKGDNGTFACSILYVMLPLLSLISPAPPALHLSSNTSFRLTTRILFQHSVRHSTPVTSPTTTPATHKNIAAECMRLYNSVRLSPLSSLVPALLSVVSCGYSLHWHYIHTTHVYTSIQPCPRTCTIGRSEELQRN